MQPKTFPIIPLEKILNVIKCPACQMLSYSVRSRVNNGLTYGIQKCFNGHLFAIREENGFAQGVGDVIHLGELIGKYNATK